MLVQQQGLFAEGGKHLDGFLEVAAAQGKVEDLPVQVFVLPPLRTPHPGKGLQLQQCAGGTQSTLQPIVNCPA